MRLDGPSFIEPPETPAPVFVVKAFKQALFGTPQAVTPAPPTLSQFLRSTENTTNKKTLEQPKLKPSEKLAARKIPDHLKADDSAGKPSGILLTPGTVGGRRKQVSFGAKVVNNEGKTSKYSNSGLPDDCPGKFPSPFTPKSVQQPSKLQKPVPSNQTLPITQPESKSKDEITKPFTKLPEQSQPASRIKDDLDITSDFNLPVSASGRYWKEQYEQYSSRSEIETKRLIAKHKLAKDYAKMKDEEALTWQSRNEMDRRKHRDREQALSTEIKDLRDRLRNAMAENSQLQTEMAVMRKQIHDTSATKSTTPAKAKPQSSQQSPPKPTPTATTEDIWLDVHSPSPHQRLARRNAHTHLRGSQSISSTRPVTKKKSNDTLNSIEEFGAGIHAPLGEINLNAVPSQRIKQAPSKSTLKTSVSKENIGTAIDHLGDISGLEGLAMLVSQPSTPRATTVGLEVRKRTPRSGGGSKLSDDRKAKAAERLAKRKKSRVGLTSDTIT
jgi:hypothetical protein